MKSKLLSLSLLMLLFVACSPDEPEVKPQTEKAPVARFSYSKNNLVVTFKNSSTNAQSYSWDFGDNSTSTEVNPTHTYKKAGMYTVTLTAIKGSQKSTTSHDIPLTESALKASFSYQTAHPLKVVLTNTSTNATSYVWDFGDGTASTEKSPIHKYKSLGVYAVKLTAFKNGKSDTYQTNVTVTAPTSCYITGFTVTKIPTNNKYYQVQLTDDYVASKTTYFYTSWFLLSSANLPYSYELKSAKQLNINKKYVIRLYKYTGTGNPDNNSQASGKGDWSATITPETLQTYPEDIAYTNSSAGMQVHLQWK